MIADGRPRLPSHTRNLFIFLAIAVLLFAPVLRGDLAGYDDALYAHIAKGIYDSGDWLHLESNGYPALEHPPLLPWMEAAFFEVFGPDDAIARLPAALCGFGSIVLTGWVARRLFQSEKVAVLSMFTLATSLYFLKYAARAMTDVPFCFFFLLAISAWLLSRDRPVWILAAGLFTGLAQMTRGLMGLALPILFLLDSIFSKRRPQGLYASGALLLAFGPVMLWYAHLYRAYGDFFLSVHQSFLTKDIDSPSLVTPLQFAWMLAKSYWPWLPAMLAGLYLTRSRFLLLWIGSLFAACVVVRHPVLRYLLPAYPAFAIASGVTLARVVSDGIFQRGVLAVLAGFALAASLLPPHWQATETRPVAIAATRATRDGERVGFYDAGASRFDESNQLQWYGDRSLYILERREDLDRNLRDHAARVYVIDRATRDAAVPESAILAAAGHLVCVRLK